MVEYLEKCLYRLHSQHLNIYKLLGLHSIVTLHIACQKRSMNSLDVYLHSLSQIILNHHLNSLQLLPYLNVIKVKIGNHRIRMADLLHQQLNFKDTMCIIGLCKMWLVVGLASNYFAVVLYNQLLRMKII